MTACPSRTCTRAPAAGTLPPSHVAATLRGPDFAERISVFASWPKTFGEIIKRAASRRVERARIMVRFLGGLDFSLSSPQLRRKSTGEPSRPQLRLQISDLRFAGENVHFNLKSEI